MNIFRVLAQGDGSINEPNVSAFLGYLLNPGEDHGLDSLFLEEFLKQHYEFCKKFIKSEINTNAKSKNQKIADSNAWLKDDFRTSGKYEVKVFFEQSLKARAIKNSTTISDQKSKSVTHEKREIVDIILVIYEVGKEDEGVETKFENYITDKRKLKQIFLIEVKIKDSACKIGKDKVPGQLENQIKQSSQLITSILAKHKIKQLEIKEKLSAVFVTPGQSECNNAKTAFKNSFNLPETSYIPKSHLFWNFPKDKIVKYNNFNLKFESDYMTFEDRDIEDIDDENAEIEDVTVSPKSIENILDEIIYPSKREKQQPIPSNTLDTIKAFSNYLYSDFSYKIKKPNHYHQKLYETFEELKKAKPTLLNPELFNFLDQSVKLIKEHLNNKIDKDNFGTTHIFSLKVNDNKFADFTNRGGKKKLLFRFLYKNFPSKNEDENIDMIKTIITTEKVNEIILNDKNSIFFHINSNVSPLQISRIGVLIYKLYQNQLRKK